MSTHQAPRLLQLLATWQARKPWHFVVIALLSILPSLWAASGLKFKSDFAELLPDNKDSVIEMRRVSKRLPGASTLSLVIETKSPNAKGLEGFVDALVPKLMALGPAYVGGVDYGVHAVEKFFGDNKLLFAKKEDLKKAHDEINERYDYEVAKRAGTLLDESDAPAPMTAERLKERLGIKKDDGAQTPTARYPRGYYENQQGTLIAVMVRTPASGARETADLRRRVEQAVAEVSPSSFDPSMKVSYTGDIITSGEEYSAIVRDLGEVGALGVAGVLGSVLLFFMRARTVLMLGASLLVSLSWTFGLTYFAIGYLNSSTGFLVSIIAGNGINYGIMYMARYVEARRDERAPVEQAILLAHRDSWVPTLASSATAMLAYGSLIFTDFRGFKHFGVIGSYGMLLCWVSAYLFLPAFMVASERVRPAYDDKRPEGDGKLRGSYGVAFAGLVTRAPRAMALVGTALSLGALALSVKYFSVDPMEYDMANIRNERKDRTAAGLLSQRVDEVASSIGQDGMAVMVDRLDQVKPFEEALMKRHAEAPADLKPFEKVVSIFSLLPDEQADKVKLVNTMRERILSARKRGFITDADWAELEPQLPKQAVRVLGVDDLPEQVARPFTEIDGTRGRIVYIAPKSGFSVWDAQYLMRWADSFRYTTLPTGEVIKGSGRAVIFADMIKTIGEDAPKAIAVSALGSILVIIFAFKGRSEAFGVFLPWLAGVCGLVAFMWLRDMKLNFLNFVALPITIGIGAEYAHNLMQRYRVEGDARIKHVVTETGGAVVLCSLTTTIGYLALLRSINFGIRSFGLAAAVGELTCIIAAVVLLPSFLTWRAQRRAARGEHKGDDASPIEHGVRG